MLLFFFNTVHAVNTRKHLPAVISHIHLLEDAGEAHFKTSIHTCDGLPNGVLLRKTHGTGNQGAECAIA